MKKRILVQESNADADRALVRYLEADPALNAEVCLVHSQEEALSELRTTPGPFDLLITNHRPAATFDRFIALVHGTKPEMPIILYTGGAGDCPNPHLQAVLMKPAGRELRAKVAALLA